MGYDLQAPVPVYLPKKMTPDETQEDYETAITQNQDGLNQNFTEHHNALQDLQTRLSSMEEAMSKWQTQQ